MKKISNKFLQGTMTIIIFIGGGVVSIFNSRRQETLLMPNVVKKCLWSGTHLV